MILLVIISLIGIALLWYIPRACPKGGIHAWQYKGTWGVTLQQKQCSKCGKLKIEDQ